MLLNLLNARALATGLVLALGLVWVGSAQATTLTFSDVVSEQPSIANGDAFDCGTAGNDPCITAAELSGTVTFDVVGTNLNITLTNTATNELTISELYFSVSGAVTGLSLTAANHSVEGDVLAGWNLNTSTGQGGPTHGDGMGIHDYSLIDGVGMSADKVGVGETIVFTLAITGSGSYTMSDFVQWSEQTPSNDQILTFATAKWTNGDGSSNFPFENNDSAFGGVVPEPSTALLVSLGLIGLSASRRRRG